MKYLFFIQAVIDKLLFYILSPRIGVIFNMLIINFIKISQVA